MLAFDHRAIVAPILAEGVAPVRALLEAGGVFMDDRIDSVIASTTAEVLRDGMPPHPVAFGHDESPGRGRGRARRPAARGGKRRETLVARA